ncbi:rhodanese-like domain-containing protein [Sporosarcina luteola]|uniref:rhodanese-like domain-containing protein n=1 Tax=Sporosarcina luteola TaxID=582850 RepID=UPI00204247CE|nr:rhodanese-like domain-containing protein [Sporosarcina luteola]MCM3710436.1 rhodanese-like domain-containing protein [Sporosarcina luteola]
MKEMTTTELQKQLENGETVNMIDVREEDEVEQGMIPGAIHIPLGEVPERLEELEKAEPYVLICRSGGRSGRAAEFLEAKGYDVTNMVGGMLDWQGDVE